MDYDFLIVGSGFGGSVAAHRLVQKGYKVGVIEQGKRFNKTDFPKTSWNVRKHLWAPAFGLHGFMGITIFKDVVIFHGAGVGGGSLVYANTHLEPLEAFYTDTKWADLADWKKELAPFYAEAKRMLGSTECPEVFETDKALKEVLTDLGTGDTFKKHAVGVFFGKPGEEVPDPYFGGEGPARTGCIFCGSCMVGCQHGAKNTLDKNYLYLAEKKGAEVVAETRVIDIQPLSVGDGSQGYEITLEKATSMFFKGRRTVTAKNVVLAGGVLGTVKLLSACRDRGSLPRLSDQLGTYVRTNSESIQAVRVKGDRDVSRGVAISSGGMHPDGTHIEMVRYGGRADSMSALATVHTGGGHLPRQLYFLAALIRHPLQALRSWWPLRWSKQVAVVLAMQALDNSMKLLFKRKWYWPFKKGLTTSWGDRTPPPTFMPAAHEVTQRLAQKLNGTPGSVLPEVLFNTTTTAHILGGCPMGHSDKDGVIDSQNRVFNYQGMYVVDGSAICANLGVNPTLTITAIAERAMSLIPAQVEATAEQPRAAADKGPEEPAQLSASQ